MVYKDMTFCLEETCAHFGTDCDRALTQEVRAAACRWWGNDNPPICLFASAPKCFESKDSAPDQA